jgi:hypothetical protein
MMKVDVHFQAPASGRLLLSRKFKSREDASDFIKQIDEDKLPHKDLRDLVFEAEVYLHEDGKVFFVENDRNLTEILPEEIVYESSINIAA